MIFSIWMFFIGVLYIIIGGFDWVNDIYDSIYKLYWYIEVN